MNRFWPLTPSERAQFIGFIYAEPFKRDSEWLQGTCMHIGLAIYQDRRQRLAAGQMRK
jgi:hypothetical protein